MNDNDNESNVIEFPKKEETEEEDFALAEIKIYNSGHIRVWLSHFADEDPEVIDAVKRRAFDSIGLLAQLLETVDDRYVEAEQGELDFDELND